MLLASKKDVFGHFTSGRKTRWFGWSGVVVIGFAVVMMRWAVFRRLL